MGVDSGGDGRVNDRGLDPNGRVPLGKKSWSTVATNSHSLYTPGNCILLVIEKKLPAHLRFKYILLVYLHSLLLRFIQNSKLFLNPSKPTHSLRANLHLTHISERHT